MQKSSSKIADFFKDQWQNWPELKSLHLSLKAANATSFFAKSIPFWVYTLAHRKNSAIGGYRKIKAGSPLEERHLLPKQKSYPIDEGFRFMVNPFPIFNQHGIVCSDDLRPQKVFGHIVDMVKIQNRVGSQYAVLYNGTASGASIPEHWHVHILPKQLFSYWEERASISPSSPIHFFDDGLRRGIHLSLASTSNSDDDGINDSIEKLEHLLEDELKLDESLLNLFLFKRDETSTEIVVFLRKAHRHRYFPSSIDSEGILISPGVVDVLGHIVCSREDDLKTLTSLALEHIFEDIFIDKPTFQDYKNSLID
jgi:hypothetical protein